MSFAIQFNPLILTIWFAFQAVRVGPPRGEEGVRGGGDFDTTLLNRLKR
jgi:hypothetical protein